MKLEDIKLGMKVIITQDRTGNGWTPLRPALLNSIVKNWRYKEMKTINEPKLNFYGNCKEKSLFSILQDHCISLSGESCIKTIHLVLSDGTSHHRENVVDALIIYNNRKRARELLEQLCPKHWKVDVFCCVEAMTVEKETPSFGKFGEYKIDVPMIAIRTR